MYVFIISTFELFNKSYKKKLYKFDQHIKQLLEIGS